MPVLEYATADVFTDRHFGGNPLAVVLDGHGLAATTMQAIAREFNYSETTFVLPPDDARHTARVRIFTPGGELPFAGHPTIGTAYILATLDRLGSAVDIVFEEQVGPVPVSLERDGDGRVLACTLTTALAPTRLETIDDRSGVAAMLGLTPESVVDEPQVWSCGVPFLVVPLSGVTPLAAARLDHERWQALLAQRSSQKVYLAARAGTDCWRVRMFAPGLGVAEDPATGGAAAAFAGWLAAQFAGSGVRRWTLLQGQEIGRPSTLVLSYEQVGDQARRVRVGGQSVLVARGTLALPDD
jgi:trans-2,3-dihydro-3-hydroxyanthranilate isomerase